MSARLVVSSRPLTRGLTTSASKAYTDYLKKGDPAVCSTPGDLTQAERIVLARALRVDQAGEIAANYIYKGQLTVLGGDPRVANLIQVCLINVSQFLSIRIYQDMWEQEKKHLQVMDKLQLQHRVRPTLLSEVAKIAGFALGTATALMGKEAAMACTEAVETVIGEHYDECVTISPRN